MNRRLVNKSENSVFLKVVRCHLEHASDIAKASLMSKYVVVEIKEPESAAPAGNLLLVFCLNLQNYRQIGNLFC